MEIRCGTESQLYQDACVTGGVDDVSCSAGQWLLWGALLAVWMAGALFYYPLALAAVIFLVGGSIVIPHLRRAYELLAELYG